ncbi:MAG: hypothetical protein E6J91_08885 [Deltaproteobacteria bacterium]|nr:MAG: hypothetical protein E6J91_08885 [Deltaproteobacteria bacterium]
MLDAGKAKARRDRAEFLALPGLEEGMDALRAQVERENRADHWADLGGCLVDYRGCVAPELDVRSGVEIPRLVPSETGWQRLASFAPAGVPSGLRTNVNVWAGRRRGDEVRLRTRDAVAGTDRELYAVVSPAYVPYDLDAIAADVARHLPADARVRVRYDRQRARIDTVLHNPHHFPDSTGTASVGEAHRLALRITTADDGTSGFALQWLVERIRCINLTLLRGERTVFRARHTRADLAEGIAVALAAQGEIAESFAAAWRTAWTSYYVDQARDGGPLDGREALRRMVFHGLVRIPGLLKPDIWSAVKGAWEAEPGDSVAHIHNAITRAAHQAPTERSWADDDVEELASAALYQRVHVLAAIPDEDRAELGWS